MDWIASRVDDALREHLAAGADGRSFDFAHPPGAPALAPADSVSWKVFGNPVSLFIGGIAAVLLELAEPGVRSGVWDHTTFRTDPLKRMRRTGLAAMITVYGASEGAEKMIEGVRRMHDRVEGFTPAGTPYRANDPDLLRWVHATAAFGFLEAYCRYVEPLAPDERDRFYQEGVPIARRYGAESAPGSESGMEELFRSMNSRLEPSAIIMEFLSIMENVPLFPKPLRFMNRVFIDAAIDLLPAEISTKLDLEHRRSSGIARHLIRFLGKWTARLPLPSSPASIARKRLGVSMPPNTPSGRGQERFSETSGWGERRL